MGESAPRRCQNHQALAAQLWPFSWQGCFVTAWLPTMNVILLCWAPLMPCFAITSLKLAREITPSPAKIMIGYIDKLRGEPPTYRWHMNCTLGGAHASSCGQVVGAILAKNMLWALTVLMAHRWVPFSRTSCLVTAWLPTMKVIVSC